MISYKTLLTEIEQLVTNSKNSTNEQQVREQLSAIRALCNLALSNESKNQSSQVQSGSSAMTNQQPSQANQSSDLSQSQNNIQNSNSVNGGKLQENDANGESIFDF